MTDPSNAAQERAWDGDEGGLWAVHADLLEQMPARYDAALLDAAGIAPGTRVLDVGCGTGVLAIAAANTGTLIAVGTDIDEASARIANENAEINDAKSEFYFASGLNDARVAQHMPYDLVFANILAAPLVELAPEIGASLKKGGVAILSGLLKTQEERILDAYRPLGFVVEQTIHNDAWSALQLRKA